MRSRSFSNEISSSDKLRRRPHLNLIQKLSHTSKPVRSFIICLVVVIVAVALIFIGNSFSQMLDNDVRVLENSDLTYYIDVIYDGIDSEITTSSDTATAKINSDFIYVEDKIPEGLTFKKFLSSDDDTIGAVKRSDNSSCPGYVVDGMAGLKYDEATRTVSFKAKSLQAGCKLTVGIVTTTPFLNGQSRLDFYNTAVARENNFSINSNTVHVFMGTEKTDVYSVGYRYTGLPPDDAPAVPPTVNYASGSAVGVASDPTLSGYTFSGWSTTDTTVSNGKFTMPDKNVEFVGSFFNDTTYKVTYAIEGDAPLGYVVPKERMYGYLDDVKIDSLNVGDIVDGYRFLGWSNSGILIEDGTFQMPKQDVELIGKFEKVSYSVMYKFQGDIIPPDGDALLPNAKQYYPGEEVTLEDEPTADGYKFLGWEELSTFKMPEEDIIIYGEWMLEAGVFTPTITMAINDKKDFYQNGDTVDFEISIVNTANYSIKEVFLEKTLKGADFVLEDGYELLNEDYAKIPIIPADSTFALKAQYAVGDEIFKNYTNEVILNGAIADGNNNLDTTEEYVARVDFSVSNIKLVINKLDEDSNVLEGSEFALYDDMYLTHELRRGLDFPGLFPGSTYYLRETKASTGYQLLVDTLKVNVNTSGEISVEGYDVTNESGVGTLDIVGEEINILPETGGSGNIGFVLLGMLIVAGSSLGFILYTKKKARRDKQ